MSEERHFRKLSELSLIDNYLFGLFIQAIKTLAKIISYGEKEI